ncbi:MAG: hypothetical protein LBV29_08500 [Azoarcus sp.]|jgi:hypothetical protein|nr:hypothetical protein [Azoarcus sp.]
MRKTICFVLVGAMLFLSACDRVADLLEMPNPARETADAEAIGSACRQTGRSIEDCYVLNPSSQKAAVFAGWKSMNDYMLERNLKEVPSVVSPAEALAPRLANEPTQPTAITINAAQPQVAAH